MPYTTKQLAEEADLSVVRIRQLCINGGLHCHQYGRMWLIQDGEAAQFLREQQLGIGMVSVDPQEKLDAGQ